MSFLIEVLLKENWLFCLIMCDNLRLMKLWLIKYKIGERVGLLIRGFVLVYDVFLIRWLK